MTPEQFAKLPKWAQMEIEHLRRDLESERRRSRSMLPTAEGGNPDCYLWNPVSGDQPLPPRSEVVFALPCGTHIGATMRDGEVCISTHRGTHLISVVPQAANVVRIRSIER